MALDSLPPRLNYGLDAAGAVEVSAVGEAGIDVGDDRLAAGGGGVEVSVEDAGGGGELELAGRAFADVEIGAAELGLEQTGGAAEDAFQPGDGIALHAHGRGRRGGLHRLLGGAGGEEEGGGKRA